VRVRRFAEYQAGEKRAPVDKTGAWKEQRAESVIVSSGERKSPATNCRRPETLGGELSAIFGQQPGFSP
jgi:hypothetical protein